VRALELPAAARHLAMLRELGHPVLVEPSDLPRLLAECDVAEAWK
jgi:hypothetical protein